MNAEMTVALQTLTVWSTLRVVKTPTISKTNSSRKDIGRKVHVSLCQEEVGDDHVDVASEGHPETVLVDLSLGVGNHGSRHDLALQINPIFQLYDVSGIVLHSGNEEEKSNGTDELLGEERIQYTYRPEHIAKRVSI